MSSRKSDGMYDVNICDICMYRLNNVGIRILFRVAEGRTLRATHHANLPEWLAAE